MFQVETVSARSKRLIRTPNNKAKSTVRPDVRNSEQMSVKTRSYRTCRKEHPTFRNEPAHIFRHMWFFRTWHVLAARGSFVGVCRWRSRDR